MILLTSESKSSPDPSRQVIWITGLSGAGKSTLALELSRRIRAKGEACIIIDGDDVRAIFGDTEEGANHSREARVRFGFLYSRLGQLIARQGVIPIISTISLAQEIHIWNRTNISGYVEIYLKVSLDELRRRDPKGIYRRYDAGELSSVWGLDLLPDEPKAPDLLVDYSLGATTEAIADQVMALLGTRTGS